MKPEEGENTGETIKKGKFNERENDNEANKKEKV